MFDREGARQIAERALDPRCAIADERVVELRDGWYFPNKSLVGPLAGSQGVIVNKRTGRLFTVGSAFPAERDMELYDRGFQFDRYDLVILEVSNAQATLDVLVGLNLTHVDPTYEYGTVWRIPRPLKRPELAERISRLPCVFGDVALYARAEVLDRARAADHFRFELLEFQRREK